MSNPFAFKHFFMEVTPEHFQFLKEGEVITDGNTSLLIEKLYKMNWWRSLFLTLGINVRVNQIKVKYQ